MKRSKLLSVALVLVLMLAATNLTAAAFNPDTEVTVGSPSTPFSQNKQNEPALAVDANHPNILAAGSNDNIDMEACNAGDDTTCPFTAGVGGSGVYFSFDSGTTWVQPTYTGWTARDCLGVVGPDPGCVPHVGPIGTLPHYYENGLISDGDPALAFGPVPGADGKFSWANGSRLYYANLASNFGSRRAELIFKGYEAIAVSRTDHVQAAAAGDANAWMDPVLVSKQSSTTFSDKEQIWADNAASSRYFGNVYVCWASFRSLSGGYASAVPLIVATSSDGGETWFNRQVTNASNNPFNMKQGFGRSGCTIRTDSRGVVYVFANQFSVGTPGFGAHIMVKSYDGGHTWTPPRKISLAVDTCFLLQFDGTGYRCVMDGTGGARDDLSSSPSVDIANGAPTGAGATNMMVRTWVDGRAGANHEHVMVSWSADRGTTWTPAAPVESPGDRGYYSAISISPRGTDAYLVYNAWETPLMTPTTAPHILLGVVKHADVSSGGPGAWTELLRTPPGDARGSSQNNLWLEFLGDYVYSVATDTYGAAVWNDVRDAADCPAIDVWRQMAQEAVANGTPVPPKPAPQQACPPNFGNTDIFGGSFPDPTP
ncbi:MAG TPA: sialidase family protein [Anaerolineales bacterium]